MDAETSIAVSGAKVKLKCGWLEERIETAGDEAGLPCKPQEREFELTATSGRCRSLRPVLGKGERKSMTTSDLICFIELNGLRTGTIPYFLECSTDEDKARLQSIERLSLQVGNIVF